MPIPEGRVTNFLCGEWLERYVYLKVVQAVQSATGAWDEKQALCGATIALPDGSQTEIDLLVNAPSGRLLWIECKTGDWQDYVAQFRFWNKRYLRLSAPHAALVLLNRLDDEDKATAGSLSAMQVLHLTDLPGWLGTVLRQQPPTKGRQP